MVSTSARVVTTCSRFGRPSDRISGSAFTSAARTNWCVRRGRLRAGGLIGASALPGAVPVITRWRRRIARPSSA